MPVMHELKKTAFELANKVGDMETDNNLMTMVLENIEITIANHVAGSSRTTLTDIKTAVDTWRTHINNKGE